MSTKSVLNFVDTVIQHFPPFRWDDEQEKAWVNTMVRELGGFSDKVLDTTVSNMVRTRKDRRIPLVSECIEACCATRRWIETEERKGELPELNSSAGDEWSTERVKLAYDLLKTELGRKAAVEGWVLSFWNFVRKNQRAPKGHEIDGCLKQAKDLDEAYAKCIRGGWPEARKWAQLGEGLLARREKLRAEALGR